MRELPDHLYQIVLMRHGQSVGNAERRHQGHVDFSLTPTGVEQARALAVYWSETGVTFDLIISSPLARARQTTETIASALEAPVEYNSLWQERDNGILSGLSHIEAAQKHPRPAFIQPYLPIGETGEGIWSLYLRAGRALQDLLGHPPGSYLVVSHGGLLNMVMYAILGISPQANFHGARFRFRNTAYARLFYNPARHDWLVETLNEQPHWPVGQDG